MKDVTLLGRGDDWKECRFNTKELWGTATCLITPELCDHEFTRVFAFDGLDGVVNGVRVDNESLRKSIQIARERKIPVMGNKDYADLDYPIRGVVSKFKWGLLCNTFSYMLADALYEDYDRIYIFGIGGRIRPDYESGRIYILSWHGVGIGKGTDMIVGRESGRWLFKNQTTYCLEQGVQENWHNEIQG